MGKSLAQEFQLQTAITSKRKKISDIRWCQNSRLFEGFHPHSFMKVSSHHSFTLFRALSHSKLQPQISVFIKYTIFGNNRDPCLVAEGKHVVAVDKDVDALAEIRSSSLVVRVCDLKDSYQIEELWRWLAGQAAVFGPVEVLVNNAGIGGARGLLDGTTAEWLAMVQV